MQYYIMHYKDVNTSILINTYGSGHLWKAINEYEKLKREHPYNDYTILERCDYDDLEHVYDDLGNELIL